LLAFFIILLRAALACILLVSSLLVACYWQHWLIVGIIVLVISDSIGLLLVSSLWLAYWLIIGKSKANLQEFWMSQQMLMTISNKANSS